MPNPTIIPTPAQRAHDASTGGNTQALERANQAISTASAANTTAVQAAALATSAHATANDAASAIGNMQVVAAEDLAAFVTITVDGYECHCNNTAHYGHLAGITVVATATGFMAPIRRSGLVNNPAWSWTPLAVIFCGPSGLTMTPPTNGWLQSVGIAQSDMSMLINLGEPILL
jgi:hypothetical protein